jgi:hypothetical protein
MSTNSSLSVHHEGVEPGAEPFHVSSVGHTVHGHQVVLTKIMSTRVLQVTSASDKVVIAQVPDGSSWQDFASAEKIQTMHTGHPGIYEDAKNGASAYDAAIAGIFELHEDKLRSFVDLAWQLGSDHNMNGIDTPHLVPFLTLAMQRPPTRPCPTTRPKQRCLWPRPLIQPLHTPTPN